MNEDAIRKYSPPPWRVSHCVWLMACLLVASVFLGRTLNFEFQEAAIAPIEQAFNYYSTPWQIFINNPTIYGPKPGQQDQIINTVSWAHIRLFDMNPFFHQLALGVWWAATLLFLFAWNRRDGRTLAGVFAVLILLAMNAYWSVLLTKTTLILICPLAFQLAALYALRKSVENSSVFSGFLFLLSLVAAAYASWQVLFTFPFVALAFVFSASYGSRATKITLMVFMAVAIAALLSTSHVFNDLPSYFDTLPSQGDLLNGLAYPAQALLSQRVMIGLALFAITFALARSGITGWVAIALGAPAIASIYFACRYYNIPVWAAYALGMAFYVNLLWVTPWRRALAIPLIWFVLSFARWYIFTGGAFHQNNEIEHAVSNVLYLESGVALAWLLGVTLSNIASSGFACLQTIRPRFRYGWRILAALLIIAALPIAIIEAYKDFSQVVKTQEAEYHTPYKIAKSKIAADLLSITGKTLHSFGGGIRLFHDLQSQIELESGPHNLDNKITLEAYTGNSYFYQPKETYSSIYVENATPAAGTERDPFFMPRMWRGVELNTRDGYNTEPLAVVTTQNEPLKTLAPSATVIGRDDFVITGWATSDAWQNVDALTLTMHQYDREFVWHEVQLIDAVPGSNAKRFVIDAFGATILRTPEHVSQTIELNWRLNPRADLEGPVEVTIARATLYIPKP